jgi:hypothetical protein
MIPQDMGSIGPGKEGAQQEILDNVVHKRYENLVAFSGILSCIIRAPEDAA